MKASIAIFSNSIKYEEDSPISSVPDEVFEVAKRVVKNKNTEVLHLNQGFYIIEYSATGPFIADVDSLNWLPVKIYRISNYKAGGIRTQEMYDYTSSKNARDGSNKTPIE
jgi:hypothetical protein